MNNLFWKKLGKGNSHLILLHGWALNSQIWNYVSSYFVSKFVVHLIDLPGFGKNVEFREMTLDKMAKKIIQITPKKSIWMGWSLGGIIANWIALMYPSYVKALITVSSSPCFTKKKGWPGINLKVLTRFQYQLEEDLFRTIKKFLILQTMGTKSKRKDSKILQDIAMIPPIPETEVLKKGLEILKETDLRKSIVKFRKPYLRIYGEFDKLVPFEISCILDKNLPNSKSLIFKNAAHVPFISHSTEFCELVSKFIENFLL